MRLVEHMSGFGILFRSSVGSLLVVMAISGSALADNGKGNNGNGKGDGGPSTSAPEIDLGSLPSALMLLAGGTMVVTERLRRK